MPPAVRPSSAARSSSWSDQRDGRTLRAVSEPLTVHVRNAIDAIPAASETVDAWLAGHQIAPRARLLISLAIEELVTNCVKYGYDDDAEHMIELELSVDDGVLSMTMVDDGRA